MSNEIPTETVKTESGHELVVRQFITYVEKRQITDVYITANELSAEKKDAHPRPGFEADDLSLKMIVLSIDGDAANVVERVHNMRLSEAMEIMAIVKQRVEDSEGKKK